MQLLANYPLLEHASNDSVTAILREADYSSPSKGTVVLCEGLPADSVIFLLEGKARIFHTSDDGREFTPKILSSPNHFGDAELLAGRSTNGQSVELLEDGLIATVRWDTLKEVLLQDHQLSLGWLAGIASQFVYTIDADRHNVFGGLPGRVANVLLSYADAFGRPFNGGIDLGIELSRDQLAKQVGSVKRSVLRIVQGFAERGWVDTRGSRMLIRNESELVAHTLPRRVGLTHAMEEPKHFSESGSGSGSGDNCHPPFGKNRAKASG